MKFYIAAASSSEQIAAEEVRVALRYLISPFTSVLGLSNLRPYHNVLTGDTDLGNNRPAIGKSC